MRNSDDFPLVMAKSLRSGRSEGPVRTDDESSSCRLTTCVPRQSERHRSSSPRRCNILDIVAAHTSTA